MRDVFAGVLAFLVAALVLASPPRAQAQPPLERLRAAEQALYAWQVEEAAAIAEELAAAHPREPRVLHLLGRVRHHQGRYEEAVRLLEPLGEAAGEYLPLARDTLEITKGMARQESEHFVFLYPPGKDEILVSWGLATLEAAWDRIGDLLGYKPTGEKIRVEVVADGEELAKVSTLSLEAIKTTGTIAVCKFDKLMITSPKALLRGYEWRDTLAHEYVHLAVARKSRNHTPIWLHEGIAKYMETAWRGEPGLALQIPSQNLLREAVEKKQLIPFEDMHPSIALLPTARDAALAFAEVFTAIEFLQAEREDAVSTLLTELGKGKSDQEAVGEVFGKPFPLFEAAWRRHLERRPYPDATASLDAMQPKFRDGTQGDDEGELRDLTELSEFTTIADPRARRAAHLGELLRSRGKMAAAAAKYAQAIEVVGGAYPSLSNKYAIALLELGEAQAAAEVLEQTRALYPTHPLTNLNLARAEMQRGNATAARPFLEASLSVNPFDPELHLRLHAVGKETGDEALVATAARAIELLGGRPPPQPTTGGTP